MKKLLVYIKDYKKESILAPLFKMLEAAFELLVPLVVASIIDVGIGNGDRAYIIKMCLLMVFLGIVGLVCSITAQFYAAKAAVGFATRLRHALFAHIQSLSFTEIDTIGTSTMITRMTSDINQVQSGVNLVLRLFLRSPFIVLGAMIMAFTVDGKAALVFAGAIPLLSIVVFGIMLISIPLYKKVQEALDKVLLLTRENLTGVRVIRAFGMEETEKERFAESNLLLLKVQKYVGKISALMNPVTYVIINGAVIALIWIGGVRVYDGVITQGEVVALVSYMSQILVELIKLANLIITVTKAIACGNRIQAVFEIEASLKEQEGSKEAKMEGPHISFEKVGLTYLGNSEESLSDIDFEVQKGETVGVIGGTGSGKTSLVHLIPRFYDATSGKVLVDGRDVKDYPFKELRDKIAIVLQKSVLFSGTIRENLLWGREDATEEDLQEALTISQAKEFVEKKEKGLETRISQGGKNLSGGQKQRLAIARALVKKPEILIMDDSASALDFATDAALRKAIREMKNPPTVFIVSQRAASVLQADKILVLEDGRIAGMGTHKELLADCEVYQEIYYSQAEKNQEKEGR
ncbi:MAG: ABC transporter ATP-binding protein/permease [Roseburia sp.]|nr:ABC transporter ATP-binding protein/permease [Roseburia sp.]MCM1277769.1 ABC transporter ATP-binding protein/permease [Robinsoniella sp.]